MNFNYKMVSIPLIILSTIVKVEGFLSSIEILRRNQSERNNEIIQILASEYTTVEITVLTANFLPKKITPTPNVKTDKPAAMICLST